MKKQVEDYWQTLMDEYIKYISDYLFENNINPAYNLKYYRKAIKELIKYAIANGYKTYSPELGLNFWKFEQQQGLSVKTLHRRHIAIRRLDEHFGCKTLVYAYIRGSEKHCPNQFEKEWIEYLSHLERIGLQASTIKMHKTTNLRILEHFAQNGVNAWSDVTAKHLADAFERSENKLHFKWHAKRFFKYLATNGILKFNYSGILPRVPYFRSNPSVYTKEETEKLISSIDRTTTLGKRDYAIIMLALRLGLRTFDIQSLYFNNIDFEHSVIEYIQDKTKTPQRLTLVPEVSEALRDYIDNGRGVSDEKYIFLNNSQKPLGRHIYSIVSKYFKTAQINIGERKCGAHALRMTFASELIEEGVPYEAVRVILGHEKRDSTKRYVKFAIESLRSCALEIPQPSGLLAEYLRATI